MGSEVKDSGSPPVSARRPGLTSRAVVHVEDSRAPRARAAHAREDAHEVGGLREAAQRDAVRAVAQQVRGLPGPRRAHDAVVLLQQQRGPPGLGARARPGLSGHAGQEEALRLGEPQVGQQRQVHRGAWSRDASPQFHDSPAGPALCQAFPSPPFLSLIPGRALAISPQVSSS